MFLILIQSTNARIKFAKNQYYCRENEFITIYEKNKNYITQSNLKT